MHLFDDHKRVDVVGIAVHFDPCLVSAKGVTGGFA